MKIIYISKFRKISVVLYVFMGWLAIFAFKEIMAHVPPLSLTFLVLGGFSYTIGLVFYAWRNLPFNHAVWHIFVIGGSASTTWRYGSRCKVLGSEFFPINYFLDISNKGTIINYRLLRVLVRNKKAA